jgi:hypothetical protein
VDRNRSKSNCYHFCVQILRTASQRVVFTQSLQPTKHLPFHSIQAAHAGMSGENDSEVVFQHKECALRLGSLYSKCVCVCEQLQFSVCVCACVVHVPHNKRAPALLGMCLCLPSRLDAVVLCLRLGPASWRSWDA